MYYDKNGQRIKEEERNTNNELLKTIQYVYDDKGMVLTKTLRDKNDTVIYEKSLIYGY
jgi:uncharacterized protein RhaS with RHS repeats